MSFCMTLLYIYCMYALVNITTSIMHLLNTNLIFQVFIRELISNASDALEKFRYLTVSSAPDAGQLQETDRSLEIRLTTDKQSKQIIFQVLITSI